MAASGNAVRPFLWEMAAAGYLSGRYPGIWDPEGVTWKEVGEKVGEFLEDRELGGSGVLLDRMVVEEGKSGISRARVVVSVQDSSAFDAAVAAFLGEDTVSVGEGEPEEESSDTAPRSPSSN